VHIASAVQSVSVRPWVFESSKSTPTRVDAFQAFAKRIFQRRYSFHYHTLRGIKEHKWRRCEKAGSPELACFSFPVVVLDRARMFYNRFTDNNMPKTD